MQHSGKQGPTIQFMNGTDAKDIVIERLGWNGGNTAVKANEDSKENNAENKDDESMDNHNHNYNHNGKIDIVDVASICCDDITQTLRGDQLGKDKDNKKSSKKRKKDKSLEKTKTKKKGKKNGKSTKNKKQKRKKKDKDKDKSSKKSKKSKKKKNKAKSKEKNNDKAKDANGYKSATTNHWNNSTIVLTEPPMKKRKIDFDNMA